MKPPFTITNTMLNKVVEISNLLGRIELTADKYLRLRKENRIKSIHSSLAIEQNSLTVEQVTAIINGKRVLGHPKEIQEVKNAYEAYDEIMSFNPYSEEDFLKAHRLLTTDIVSESGVYRSKDVGIYDESGQVVHMGARPPFIANLMKELFEWGQSDDTPALIKSCVFHYEIEMIHPFEDGNGRMGRLWQTVILSSWNPIFSWLPVETIIHDNQQEYYRALGMADKDNSSTVFIEFMLNVILRTLQEYQMDSHEIPSPAIQNLTTREQTVFEFVASVLEQEGSITVAKLSERLGLSPATARRFVSSFVKHDLLEPQGGNRNRSYRLKE